MPDFQKMYLELYNSVNEALQYLVQGKPEDAVICLLEGQVNTIEQIFINES